MKHDINTQYKILTKINGIEQQWIIIDKSRKILNKNPTEKELNSTELFQNKNKKTITNKPILIADYTLSKELISQYIKKYKKVYLSEIIESTNVQIDIAEEILNELIIEKKVFRKSGLTK